VTSNPLCKGADPNRNWNVNWGSYGGSSNPCSAGYVGDYVFSEPETRQLADFLHNQFSSLFAYISFHSYGQLLMTPYAYSNDNSEHNQTLFEIGAKAIDEIATFRGASYELGPISRFFGLIAGSSVDYVELNLNPTLTYCYELSTNHILANDEIIATGQEIFASIKTIFEEAIDRGLALLESND
jgi:carboxypeptidase A4